MLLWRGLLLVVFVTQVTAQWRCEERLDVINADSWNVVRMAFFFGQHLVEDATLVAVGFTDGSTHAVIHTSRGDTFLRGSSTKFHLYGNNVVRELSEIRGLTVVNVAFGSAHIIIQTDDSRVWTAGDNSYGQLGHHGFESRPVFSAVDGLIVPGIYRRELRGDITIAAGGNFSVVMVFSYTDGTRKLFSWGSNSEGGLGHSFNMSKTSLPTHFNLGTNTTLDNRPRSVCCGTESCTALSYDYGVYTWGSAHVIGRAVSDDGRPTLVQGIPDDVVIAQVSCGERHTLALSSSGRLFSWGMNDHGERLDGVSSEPYASELPLEGRIVRNVVAGKQLSLIQTYSPRAEYFGYVQGENFSSPREYNNVYHPRDIMKWSTNGEETWGAVPVEC